MLGAGLFAPAPVQTPAGHGATFEQTERRLAPLLARVPITRVYEATALDRLGLPVWAAVTPLALDLTVHAGKGTTRRAARLSAVMEAIERVCAETVAPERLLQASFSQICGRGGPPPLDPELFDLPYETAYGPDVQCSWVTGFDLLAEQPVRVPLDLVVSPAAEGMCVGVESNGLAAGNLAVEATLHAIYEVVERDAAARERFLRLYGEGAEIPAVRLIDPATVPASVRGWLEPLARAGISVTLQALPHGSGIPVFQAVLADPAFPGREGESTAFEGLGADLEPEVALMRALTEAVQAHTVVLVGARDTFEGGTPVALGLRRLLERLGAGVRTVPFAPEPGAPPDLAARLELVLGRLRAAGFEHCVVIELTRADLGVPVVRVLLAGAAGPYGETARRPGLRLLAALA